MNKNSVMMMIYTPDGKYKGVNNDYAQQIDLYPTILDIIGYKKPFRSWGRSLFDTQTKPFAIRHSSNRYQFMSGNYICTFNGKEVIGFYKKEDKALQHNLINKRNAEMNLLEVKCKAFIQDYMKRIIDKQLAGTKMS